MIGFFRKIRKKLADDNEPIKYMRYAVGEILLIIVGILFALYLQNLNEKGKQKEQFNEVLNKLYTTINTDIESVYPIIGKSYDVLRINDYMLNRLATDSILSWQLPHLLFRMEAKNGINIEPNNANYYSSLLNPNPESEIQNELTRLIVNFSADLSKDFYNYNEISNYLKSQDIPKYGDIGNAKLGVWESRDSIIYTKEEIQLVKELLRSKTLRAKLKSFQLPIFEGINVASDLYNMGEIILKKIKEFYPNAKLGYNNIGIIGTAINGFIVDSTPMEKKNENESIWEIELYLKNGDVKFNSNNNWNYNWGGNEFPSGRTLYWGGDISVTEGNYHIILNLEDNSYEFVKLGE